MPPTKQPTSQGTAEVSADAGPLDLTEVTDDRDVSPRQAEAQLQNGSKYIKAFPTKGATTLRIPASDFKQYGNVDHDTVEFDFRNKEYKLLVGSEISQEAADLLTGRYPETFKYVTGV